MPRMHIIAYTLLIAGILFLVGLTGLPTAAAGQNDAPMLQPSPRPTSTLPTPRPTSALPTPESTPTTGAPTSEPRPAATQVPLPTPTLTPTPALLPNSGGAFYGAWPLALGICFILLGIGCLFARQQCA